MLVVPDKNNGGGSTCDVNKAYVDSQLATKANGAELDKVKRDLDTTKSSLNVTWVDVEG